jgi:PAS domain S-box-containing protein
VSNSNQDNDKQLKRIAFRIAFIYLCFSGVWVCWSDRLVELFINDPNVMTKIHIFKGFVFISVTSVIIYFLLLRAIRKLKNTEKTLAERETWYTQIYNLSQDCIFIHDIDTGVVLDCNQSVLNLYGCTKQEIIGRHVGNLSAGNEGFTEEKARDYLKSAATKGPQMFLWKIKHKDGQDHWAEVLLNKMTIFDKSYILAHVRDISARTKAEQALVASEERFSKAFRFSPDAMGIFNVADETFLEVNQSFVRIFGYSSIEDVIGKHVRELNLIYNVEKYKKMLELLISGGVVLDYSTKIKNAVGVDISIQMSTDVIQVDNMDCILFIIRDVTKQKLAEEERLNLESQLMQAQKMEAIGQLAGGIAHDFNNILQVIFGFGELALHDAKDGSSPVEDIEQIIEASGRAKILVSHLLAYSRRQVLKIESLNLNEAVRDLIKMLNRVIGEHIDLNINLELNISNIRGDRMQIEQILTNLCLNARDAMPDGGVILVKTKNVYMDKTDCMTHSWAKIGHFVLLSVSDTGSGISDGVVQQIFEPFFTTKAVGEGSGLGLSMVYGLVQQHRGMINVSSGVGKGTTFDIYFPVTDDLAQDKNEHKENIVLGGSETILLAEDDEYVRSLCKHLLEEHGYKVIEAVNGRNAVNLFMEHQDDIELALLDVVMPELGGKEVYDCITNIKPNLPVVFASGYLGNDINREFASNEKIVFIQKPYKIAELLQTIRQTIDEVKGAD